MRCMRSPAITARLSNTNDAHAIAASGQVAIEVGRGGPLAHDHEPSLAGRHQLIAICVHEEQKMQATLTSQPSNEDKTTAACVNRRNQSPTHHLAADSY